MPSGRRRRTGAAGFALSFLVSQQHYDAVPSWVNSRQLTFADAGGAPKARASPMSGFRTGDAAAGGPCGIPLLLADCIEIVRLSSPYLMGEGCSNVPTTALCDVVGGPAAASAGRSRRRARSCPAIGTKDDRYRGTTRAAGRAGWGQRAGRSRPCARNSRGSTPAPQAAADYAAAAERDGCRPSPEAPARLDTYAGMT